MLLALDGDAVADASNVDDEEIDRHIMRVLMTLDTARAASPATMQHLQKQPAHPQQQLPDLSANEQPGQYSAGATAAGSHTALYAQYSNQQCQRDSVPSMGSELSVETGSFISPQCTPAAPTNIQRPHHQWYSASDSLNHNLGSNLDEYLQGAEPAVWISKHLEPPLDCIANWHSPQRFYQSTAGPDCEFAVTATNFPTAPAAFKQIDCTPSAEAVPQTAGQQHSGSAAAAASSPAAVRAAMVDANSQEDYLRAPASSTAAMTAAAAAGLATENGSKRSRRPNSNRKGNKRQRLPPLNERELQRLRQQLASATEEADMLKSQLSAVQAERSDLVDRMSRLTQNWQATVSELARLHQENLALLERLSATQGTGF